MKILNYKKYKTSISLLNSTQYIFYVFNKRYLTINYSDNFGWIRLFGIGIKWKHIKLGLTFSERNGYIKFFTIGGYRFMYLTKK